MYSLDKLVVEPQRYREVLQRSWLPSRWPAPMQWLTKEPCPRNEECLINVIELIEGLF